MKNLHISIAKNRINKFPSQWEKIMAENKIVYNWDNIYAFNILSEYMKKYKSIISDVGVALVFMDIIKFLMKQYKKKYIVIYE